MIESVGNAGSVALTQYWRDVVILKIPWIHWSNIQIVSINGFSFLLSIFRLDIRILSICIGIRHQRMNKRRPIFNEYFFSRTKACLYHFFYAFAELLEYEFRLQISIHWNTRKRSFKPYQVLPRLYYFFF